MYQSHQGRFRQQFTFLRQQFLQEGQLPLTDVLTAEVITQALQEIVVAWKDRIFTPLVALWVFLGQVLSGDHSCLSAVARLVSHRVAHGQPACSVRTGASCQARKRLPEKFFATAACQVGRQLDAQVDPRWLWKGRRVYMFDGTTVNMPDTPENQAAYPQVYNQRQGLGFPIARVGAIISLACGAILNLGVCQYAGKEQGEVSLLRKLWDILCPGDILLTDRLLANWLNICELKQRGVDFVGRLNKANRKADFRRGQRLGSQDHIVRWPKPKTIRSVDRETYRALPEFITVREAKIQVKQPGFRTKSIVVVTTLLDPDEATREDLGALYLARWNNELDLRAIKSTMQMDELRCKTPEMVHREIWAHVLAYNLIRTVMAQAAAKQDLMPRTISFKGAIQILEAFQPVIELQSTRGPDHRLRLYQDLLDAIASRKVGNRPGRFEPRAKKHRRNHYDFLMRPRAEIKRDMAKGVINI
jgi:hypothetical protein